MLYSKPENLKYTDMAKFFDGNFFTEERDDEKCYKYMYLIYYMLACKARYFHKFEDYDKYAILAANTIYMRFLKKYRNGELEHRSILNYAKATLYPLKIAFQREEYREFINSKSNKNYDSNSMKESLRSSIQCQYNVGLEEAVIDVFKQIPNFIDEELKNTPYRSSELEYRRLYMSILLILLKGITLNKSNDERFKIKGDSMKESQLVKMYANEREKSTTVWRLSRSMKDYVENITKRVYKRISSELIETKNMFELDIETLDAILMSAWESTSHTDTNNFDGEE